MIRPPQIMAAALSVSVSLACAARGAEEPRPCPPKTVTIAIETGEKVNPPKDQPDMSLAVHATIVQLRDPIGVNQLRFEDVIDRAEEFFQDRFLKQEEIEIFPDSRKVAHVELADGVTHVATMASFVDPVVGPGWYTVYRVPRAVACTAEATPVEQECYYVRVEGRAVHGSAVAPEGAAPCGRAPESDEEDSLKGDD